MHPRICPPCVSHKCCLRALYHGGEQARSTCDDFCQIAYRFALLASLAVAAVVLQADIYPEYSIR